MGNKIVITIGLWLFSLLIMSGQGIPIQLMVVDADGFEKVNHDVKLRLTMSNDTSSTAGQYQEVHITQSNEFGIVSVEMGSGISTTNSQVLGISQFTFSDSEPFIKVELDTSQLLNQYYEVGHVPYSYTLISRRAFKADSADFAYQSTNSVFADTAQFALNFNESYDGDTSALNELQTLNYDANTNTISITSGNSISLASNSKVQVSSDLIPLEINQSNFYQWKVADSNFLYGFSGSNLLKAPIASPDSITSIDVGFGIHKVSPYDSLVFGFDNTYPTYKLYKCDLIGQNTTDKYMGSYSDDIVSQWTSIKDSIVSIVVAPYSGSHRIYSWDVHNNSLTYQTPSYQGRSNRFLVGKYYVSNQGYRIQTFDRFSGTTYQSISGIGQNSWDLACIDSTGRMLVTKDYYGSSQSFGFGRILLDSTYQGSFSILGTYGSITEGRHGHCLFTTTSPNQMMYLFNPYRIENGKSVSKIALDNWSANHPESSGGYYVIPGHDAFLIYFLNVENYWINGAFRSGDFLLTIPYES